MLDMVYCPRCGTENEEDALECKSCGASLHPPTFRAPRRRWEDDLCFGRSRRIPIWGLIIGVVIILWGVSSLLGDVYWWASWDKLWPIFVIAIGLIIILNALSRRL